jgi:hypothetical protein
MRIPLAQMTLLTSLLKVFPLVLCWPSEAFRSWDRHRSLLLYTLETFYRSYHALSLSRGRPQSADYNYVYKLDSY